MCGHVKLIFVFISPEKKKNPPLIQRSEGDGVGRILECLELLTFNKTFNARKWQMDFICGTGFFFAGGLICFHGAS